MISERLLRSWRKISLQEVDKIHTYKVTPQDMNIDLLHQLDLHDRILRLTQELLDQALKKQKK